MAFDKYLNKAKRALQGEKSRQALDRAEGAARRATSGKHDGMISKARRAADRALGRGDDPRDPRDPGAPRRPR